MRYQIPRRGPKSIDPQVDYVQELHVAYQLVTIWLMKCTLPEVIPTRILTYTLMLKTIGTTFWKNNNKIQFLHSIGSLENITLALAAEAVISAQWISRNNPTGFPFASPGSSVTNVD